MKLSHWIWVVVIVLSGCAVHEEFAAIGVYTPVGLRGAEHCESSNHCVIRTEIGKTHLSVSKHTAVTIGFHGRGGDVKHYFDYLVTIRNIGKKDLFFDPKNIDGYDPDALLERIRKEDESLSTLAVLEGLSSALGGRAPNMASLKYFSTRASQDRAITTSQYEKQKLVAQVIPPGGEVGGRLVVKSSGRFSKYVNVSIPIGSDVHTVRFAKRVLPKVKRRQDRNLEDISGEFSFDGRWLVITTGGGSTSMIICNLRTERDKILEECDQGARVPGTVRGRVATFPPSTPSSLGYKIIAVDQNTLRSDHPLGYTTSIYERQ